MNKASNTQKENLAMEASGAPSKLLYTIFALSAILGISGWLFLLSIYIFWIVEPTNLPTVKEPIPVLNENNEVAIGDALLMEFQIIKLQEITPIAASRFLECKSGNLVTLTSAAINLPVGNYTITSNEVIIPQKVSPNDRCIFVIQVTYQLNPLKQIVSRFESESFKVLPVGG